MWHLCRTRDYPVSIERGSFGVNFGNFLWFLTKKWEMTIFHDFRRKKSPSKICFRYQRLYVTCTIWTQEHLCSTLWCQLTGCVHNRHICCIYKFASEAKIIYTAIFWKFHLWFDKTNFFLFFQKILSKIYNIFFSQQNRLIRKKVMTTQTLKIGSRAVFDIQCSSTF